MNSAAPFWPTCLVALSALCVFCFGVTRSNWSQLTRRVLDSCVQGVSAVFDPEMSDRDKERAVRRSGVALLISAFGMGWRMIVAIWAAVLPVALASLWGWADAQHVIELMLSLEFILGTSLGASIFYLIWCRLTERKSALKSASKPKNTMADQLVHTLAFSSPWVMKSLSAIDDIAAHRALKSVPDLRPIFVTSLARGGTTALLNALHDIPGFAAHVYRDMPLITAPYIWSKLSGHRKVARTGMD